MRDRILVTEILEERRECRELAANGRTAELSLLQMLAPSNDVSAGDDPKLLRPPNPKKTRKVMNVNLIGAPGALVINVGKPLDFGRHRGQVLKLRPRQHATRSRLRNQIFAL